jgi:phenylacetate-coenzyme A ligase PaaK-like adenylate-forming protein
MLVTTLDNPWYYMLRFDVGDFARLDEAQTCACGRKDGWIISEVEGRWTNVTLDTAGRIVTMNQLDKAVSAIDNLDEYRLEQPAEGSYKLFLVSKRKDRAALIKEADAVLHKVYGRKAKTEIVFETTLAPEDSGKYALAKTLFPMKNIEEYLDTAPAIR